MPTHTPTNACLGRLENGHPTPPCQIPPPLTKTLSSITFHRNPTPLQYQPNISLFSKRKPQKKKRQQQQSQESFWCARVWREERRRLLLLLLLLLFWGGEELRRTQREGENDHDTMDEELFEVFASFCSFGDRSGTCEMDGARFAKLCKGRWWHSLPFIFWLLAAHLCAILAPIQCGGHCSLCREFCPLTYFHHLLGLFRFFFLCCLVCVRVGA